MLSAWRYDSPLLENLDGQGDLCGGRTARGACRQEHRVGRLEIRCGSEPHYPKDGCYRGCGSSPQKGQWPHVTQEAAMVLRMVRFFLGGQRKRRAQQRQARQQENQQCFRGMPAVASYTDTIIGRPYGFSLPELGWRATSGPRCCVGKLTPVPCGRRVSGAVLGAPHAYRDGPAAHEW